MLARLSIRDIVLIDQLDLEFSRGLTILTGETGAGKSILVDALAFVLGGRAGRRGARPGVLDADGRGLAERGRGGGEEQGRGDEFAQRFHRSHLSRRMAGARALPRDRQPIIAGICRNRG